MNSGRGKSGPNPTDRGKVGVKHSLLTEEQGVPIALTVAGTNRHDMKLVYPTLESIVVERTHSWMNRFRRILVRGDKKPENYMAFLHFACALITFRADGLFG